MRTTFYILRHGESLGNKEKRFLGHTDLDMSELGYTQARLTAEKLSNVHFDYIYSSDLKRAYNTALPHANLRNMEIITSDKLRELYAGRWEGKTVEQIMAMDEDLFINGWRKSFGLTTLPEGENVIDGGKRFLNELSLIGNSHKGKVVLVATHAAVLRSFWSLIIGLEPIEFASSLKFAGNASYSIVDYQDGTFYPIVYSVCEHLGELATFVDEKAKK